MIARLRPAPLAAALLGLATVASALAADGGRPAEAILADFDAVANPKLDRESKDPQAVQKFRDAYTQANARRGVLALELFRAHPEHERVPQLLLVRWPDLTMGKDTAGPTIAEIDEALPRFRDPEQAGEARYMRAVASIRAKADRPEEALPAVEAYLAAEPKGRRAAMILNGYANEVNDPALKTRLLKRVVAEYPDNPLGKAAAGRLAVLDNVGKPLDLEFTDAIGGQPVSIKGLRGKVVVLDFWATWCGPCVAEMPRMKELYARFKDQGVEFIGVSLDAPPAEGGLDKLKSFVAKNEIPWPQYYQGDGFDSAFSTRMGINAIPQLFLVDAEGNLASIEARGQLETLIPEYLAKARAKGGDPAPPPPAP